jgi:peptidoglycan endopeptidase LytE
MFPRLAVACFALVFVSSLAAQTNQAGRPRTILSKNIAVKPIETEDIRVPATSIEARALIDAPLFDLFRTALRAVMESHVGAHYHYGSTGPNSFDCSGFVWSSFQDTGVKFQRGPARSYWSQFEPVSGADRFKFGTLVFFGRLAHVGVVVDERGFYHSSRHHGVIYSQFNDYWKARIDGFRRVPINSMQLTTASARVPKPANPVIISVDER